MDDEETIKGTGGADRNENTSSKTERLFHEFLSRRESGEKVSPEDYIRDHPELEVELKALFAKYDAGQREEMDLGEAAGKSPKPREVIGDFRLIREIGKGGMGTVYEAEQISLKRKVALKVLPAIQPTAGGAVFRWTREDTHTEAMTYSALFRSLD